MKRSNVVKASLLQGGADLLVTTAQPYYPTTHFNGLTRGWTP